MKKILLAAVVLGLIVSAVGLLGCGGSGSSSTTTTTLAPTTTNHGSTTTIAGGSTTTTIGGTDLVIEGVVSYAGPSAEITVQALTTDLSGAIASFTAPVSAGQAPFALDINGTAGTRFYLVAEDCGPEGNPGIGSYGGGYGIPGSSDITLSSLMILLTSEGTVFTLTPGVKTGYNFSLHKVI